MYGHSTITPKMLRGVHVVVSGAPCVAYSRARARRGRTFKLGMIYIDQIDVYLEARVPVGISERVTGVLEVLDTDKVSKADGICAQTKLEDNFRAAGYQVTRKVINSAEYGAPVIRERLITVAIRSVLAAKKQFEWPAISTPKNNQTEERSTVRYFLDEKPHSRYLLPLSRMHKFERNANSWQTSRAQKLYTRSKIHGIGQNGSLGNPYDPNDVYSLDASAASFTAAGNTRYYAWNDENGIMRFRGMSPREVALCMGIPVKLITGLDEKDAYRLTGNSVSSALDHRTGTHR